MVFGAGQYATGSGAGRSLLAHELTHVVQQGGALNLRERKGRIAVSRTGFQQISRDTSASQKQKSTYVSYVTAYIGSKKYIDFHTSQGLYRYQLNFKGGKSGEYNAEVEVTGNNIYFTLPKKAGSGKFAYRIKKGQPNPSTFFAEQSSVVFVITRKKASALSTPKARTPSYIKYMSLQEILKRCKSGKMKVKTFPYRGTRFGGAPIMAHSDGKFIYVKQPLYVHSNKDFRKQTRTLPISTFLGGVRLYPNDYVRVHSYEPRW